MKRSSSKPGKAGRSLEEVVVRRKLLVSGGDPTSWPDARSPLDNLPSLMMGASSQPSSSSVSQHDEGEVVRHLKDYCRALQNKCRILESNLEGTVTVMQRELQETRKSANEKLESQQRLLIKSMDEAYAAQAQLAQMTRWRGNITAAAAAAATASYSSSSSSTSMHRVSATNDAHGNMGMSGNSPEKAPRRTELPKQSAAAKPNTIQSIANHMTELDMKVLQLKELFRHGDPLVERRQAATKIVASIRGFLQRVRFASFQKGLREWKWIRCRQVVWLLDMRVASKKQVTQGLEQMRMLISMRTQFNVFARWVLMVKQARPVRQQMYQRAHEMALAKDKALLRLVFEGLRLVTVGKKSTKHANESRRLLINSIREELSDALKAKGEIGIVPLEDIERLLYQRVIQEFIERKRILTMKNVWVNGLFKNLQLGRLNTKKANEQWLQVRAGRCFYAWSDWLYMVSAGLDRKRWSAPRKYEVRYNQKRIDGFAKLRLKRHVFLPWKEFFKIQHLVRKGYQRQVARFVRDNFRAWRALSITLRALRIVTLDNWKGYARLLTQVPFQAWAGFVQGIKNHQAEQQRIVNSYIRWKWRQRIVIIMKRWRHQALYGRMDGLYSRQMLINSLNEQKIMSSGLEKILASQTVEMDELRELTEREIAKRKGLEERLKDAVAEVHKNKMFFHHSEQELRRSEALVESMAILNPRQIDHIKKLQPQFRFKLRKVHVPIGEGESEADNLTGADGGGGGDGAIGDDDGDTVNDSLVDEEGGEDGTNVNGASDGQTVKKGDVSKSGTGRSSPETGTGAGDAQMQSTPSALPPGAGYYISSISHEDQILLDRIKWIVRRFSAPKATKLVVPTLKPGEEIRTVDVQEVVVAPAVPASGELDGDAEESKKSGSDDDDDDKGPSRRRNRFDDAPPVVTPSTAEPPIVKTVTTTTLTWTPGELILPVRGPILHSSKPRVMGDEGQDGQDGAPTVVTAPAPATATPTATTATTEAEPMSDDLDQLAEDAPPASPILPPLQADMATKMFLGVIDFLLTGDASNLAPEDRHDWLTSILTNQQQQQPPGEGTSFSQAIPTGETVLGEKSWREALVYLRTMFPGAGNYSGVGTELDDAETAMYWRIAEMRDNLNENTQRFATKLLQARTVAARRRVGSTQPAPSMTEEDLGGGGLEGAALGLVPVAPVNVYASNLRPGHDEDMEVETEEA